MTPIHHQPPELGRHGYDGSYAPGRRIRTNAAPFSVGASEWVPTRTNADMKRGKVKVRITGSRSRPIPVFEAARTIAEALDNGTYQGPSRLRVENLERALVRGEAPSGCTCDPNGRLSIRDTGLRVPVGHRTGVSRDSQLSDGALRQPRTIARAQSPDASACAAA